MTKDLLFYSDNRRNRRDQAENDARRIRHRDRIIAILL